MWLSLVNNNIALHISIEIYRMCFVKNKWKILDKKEYYYLCFILAGIVYNKVTRPDHLNDLLTLPSNNKGAKPKSAKNQRKSQNKQKPAKTEGQIPEAEKYQK